MSAAGWSRYDRVTASRPPDANLGRLRARRPETVDEMRRLRSGGAMPADLAEAFGVSLRTVYRYLGSGPVVRVRLGPWEGSFEVRETGPVLVAPWRRREA